MVRNERVVTIFQGGIVKFYINSTIEPFMPAVVPIIQIILIVIIRAFLVAITQIESSYYHPRRFKRSSSFQNGF